MDKSSPLVLPDNIELPFFAYGFFKRGERAHHQIKAFVTSVSPENLPGRISVRDGLPLYQTGVNGVVPGDVFNFNEPQHAYSNICEFEPKEQYQWGTATTDTGKLVNVLLGRSPDKASEPIEGNWSSSDDPVFRFALDAVRKVVHEYGGQFRSDPPEHVDWIRFFRLEMAYLLLWSILERYTAFRYGPVVDPTKRIKKLGKESVFAKALYSVERKDNVVDARDPRDKYGLDRDNPEKSVLYYYQIRNNLSHRGKGAWKEADRLRLALEELTAIATALVHSREE